MNGSMASKSDESISAVPDRQCLIDPETSSMNMPDVNSYDEETAENEPMLNASESERVSSSASSRVPFLFYVIDVLVSIIVIAPLTTYYWYSTWSYMDAYLLKSNQLLSNVVSYAIGLGILLPTYVFQYHYQRFYMFLMRQSYFIMRLMGHLFRIVYIYLVSFSIVSQWRGIWNLCDMFFYTDWLNEFALAIVAFAYFCLTRTTTSLLSTPFVLTCDDFIQPFSSEKKSHACKFLFDFIITEMLQCCGLVVAWRGVETMFNEHLSPNDPARSLLLSGTSGHLVYFLIAMTQKPIARAVYKKPLAVRILVGDTLNILMFFSAVLIWKFYWNGIDFYIYTKSYDLPLYFMGHFGVFVVCTLLKTSVLLGGPGPALIDGEIDEAIDIFQFEYFSSIKKLQRPANIVSLPVSGENENSSRSRLLDQNENNYMSNPTHIQ